MKKIVLTGGHAATTAISVIEEIVRRCGKDGIDINWIGSASSLEGRNVKGLELKVFKEMGIKSHLITAGKIQRKFTRWTIPAILKFPIGLIQAIYLILKIRPSLTLSFGGYAAFPVTFASWLFGVPVVIHEQTEAVGLANKLSGKFAKKILLAREGSSKYFGNKNIEVVGNPVMTQIAEVEPKIKLGNHPVIFVMGGSRGSERINDAVLSVINELLKKYLVIHITGEGHFEKFSKIKNKNYQVYSLVDPMQIDNLYKQADLVVARSGANTVSELMIVKRPAILIPIPWSYNNEQELNAKRLVEFGTGTIINQNELTGERLLNEIEKVLENWSETVSKVKNKKSPDIGASSKVLDSISEYIK